MVNMSIFDFECAELIHSFSADSYLDFCAFLVERYANMSELEFVWSRFDDFKAYALDRGYNITDNSRN